MSIDTLKLFTNEYTTLDNNYNIINIPIESNNYSLEIKYGKLFLKINSLSVLLYNEPLKPVDFSEPNTYQQLIKAINDILDSYKIEVNVYELVISRLDLYKDIIVNEPINHYLEVIKSHAKYRNIEPEKYSNTGITFSNKSSYLHFYDKISQLKTKKTLKKQFSNYKPKLLRYEVKLQKAKKVKEVFKKRLILKDLSNTEITSRFEVILKQAFYTLFKLTAIKKPAILLNNSRHLSKEKILEIIKEKYPRNIKNTLTMSFVVENISYSELHTLLKNAKMNRNSIRNIELSYKKVENLIVENNMNINDINLLQEIFQKFSLNEVVNINLLKLKNKELLVLKK